MKFKATEIAAIIEGTVYKLDENTTFSRVVIDSRDAAPGDLFVALPGENVDGHDFVADAAAQGASVALVEKEIDSDIGQIIVEDTGRALLELAGYRRGLFEGKTIAVTGSCGKTTTKDMIVSVLSQRFEVHGPRGNYNTELGVPLTILEMPDETEILVLELGVSEPGDMDALGAITDPDIAVVTCVGPTHTEFLGDIEGVAREKGRLMGFITHCGVAVLNSDDELVSAMADNLPEDITVMRFGIENFAVTFASDIDDRGAHGVSFKLDGETDCHLLLPGIYNLYNALAAASVAKNIAINRRTICRVLGNFKSGNMRSQVVEIEGVTYIIDCYNSSPKAARAALDTLAVSGGDGRTWAVLGEMRELGDIAEEEHRSLGRYAAELGIDYLVGYGAGGGMIVAGAADANYLGEAVTFGYYDEIAKYVLDNIGRGDVALFKASRGVELENILKIIGVIE